MSLADRLQARGVDPTAFCAWAQPAAWAQAAGVGAPLEHLDDRELDGLIATYRQAVGSPTRRPPASRMTLQEAERINTAGAQRHRDRMLLERVVAQVVRQAARRAQSQWQHCYQCTPRVPCYRHGG